VLDAAPTKKTTEIVLQNRKSRLLLLLTKASRSDGKKWQETKAVRREFLDYRKTPRSVVRAKDFDSKASMKVAPH
jgi:hypothetical protein